jgi:hypothetical protein
MGELRATHPRRRDAVAAPTVHGSAAGPAWNDETARILELHRTAGNAAVTTLVAPVVQRAPIEGTGDEDAGADLMPAAAARPGPEGPTAAEDVTAGPGPEIVSAPEAAPASPRKTRSAVRGLAGTHTVAAGDRAAIPAAADRPALVAEWIELDNRRKEKLAAKEPIDAGDAARLAEVNRLLHLRRKADAADTLAGNGWKDGAAAWYADVKDTTFLGRPVRVHRLLADRLDTAEAAFLAAVQGQDEPDGGWVRSTSTLRDPQEGLHGLGLAIDLNPGTNPYLINPSGTSQRHTGEPLDRSQAIRDVIDRAVLLVLNRTAKEEDFSAMPDIEDAAQRVEASYTKLSEASQALGAYFTLDKADNAAELDRLMGELGDRNPKRWTAKTWRNKIKGDRTTITGAAARKDWQRPTSGFMDLPWELVKALTDTGLTWLGDNTIGSGRDIMHFDMRGLGPVKRIFNSEKNKWTSLG